MEEVAPKDKRKRVSIFRYGLMVLRLEIKSKMVQNSAEKGKFHIINGVRDVENLRKAVIRLERLKKHVQLMSESTCQTRREALRFLVKNLELPNIRYAGLAKDPRIVRCSSQFLF